jgi:hypothetical protein
MLAPSIGMFTLAAQAASRQFTFKLSLGRKVVVKLLSSDSRRSHSRAIPPLLLMVGATRLSGFTWRETVTTCPLDDDAVRRTPVPSLVL